MQICRAVRLICAFVFTKRIVLFLFYLHSTFEPPHGKTNNLHRRKTKAQISFTVTAKLISAFVFATRIVQFLFYLNLKFQASSSFLCLYSRPVRKPHCWFSHELAHFKLLASFHDSTGRFVSDQVGNRRPISPKPIQPIIKPFTRS